MATILTKKKDTTGAPSAGDLTNSSGGAELAVNTADKRLYTKDSGGNVVEVGINPTSITTGTLNTSGAVVFNDAGADVDFRVEGDTDANLLFVDASTDRVGVSTNAPSGRLDISYNADTNVPAILIGADSAAFGSTTRTDATAKFGTIGGVPYTNADGFYNVIGANSSSGVNGVSIGGSTSGLKGATQIVFATAANTTSTGTERMRITSAGAVQIANGNLVFSTNGTGIDFSASAGGGATSSLLDDYEEGTWTPSLLNGTTTTYTVQSATYTKVGRQVFIRAQLIINSVGNGNTVRITGLPFTAASVPNPGVFAVGYFANLANNKIFVTGAVRNAEANADFYSLAAAAADNGDTAIFQNGTRIDFAGCYQVP